MPKDVQRGYVPSDARDFSPAQIALLQKAQLDIACLLDRGYDLVNSVTFVGNHHQFSARQRTALTRATAKTDTLRRRREKQRSSLAGATVHIDGFNLIITLEAALSAQTVLLQCMDGSVRDLCGLRGTYRIIADTAPAIRMVAQALRDAKIRDAVIYMDAPVSNSGRLKDTFLSILEEYNIPARAEMVPNADVELWDKECVVSSDGIILDRCQSWVNMAQQIITEHLPERQMVVDYDLSRVYVRAAACVFYQRCD